MIEVVPAKVQVGDVTFKFRDSCNCCCWSWKRKPKKTTEVFVKKEEGAVERFDPQKARDVEEALRKNIENLRGQIAAQAEKHDRDFKAIVSQLEETIERKLDPEQPQALTWGVLQKISGKLRELFSQADEGAGSGSG